MAKPVVILVAEHHNVRATRILILFLLPVLTVVCSRDYPAAYSGYVGSDFSAGAGPDTALDPEGLRDFSMNGEDEAALIGRFGTRLFRRFTFNPVLPVEMNGRYRPVDRILLYFARGVEETQSPRIRTIDTRQLVYLTFFLYHNRVVDHTLVYIHYPGGEAELHDSSTAGSAREFTKLGEFWPQSACHGRYYFQRVLKDKTKKYSGECYWQHPGFVERLEEDGFFDYGLSTPYSETQ